VINAKPELCFCCANPARRQSGDIVTRRMPVSVRRCSALAVKARYSIKRLFIVGHADPTDETFARKKPK